MMKKTLILLTLAVSLSLTGCASLVGGGSDTPKASRTISDRQRPSAPKIDSGDKEAGLRLAHMLLSQERVEGALGVFAELDRKGVLNGTELLEYASVYSLMHTPQDTLPLFARAEKTLNEEGTKLDNVNTATLQTGLGRAYMAVGDMESAKAALQKAVAADDKNFVALNALGVLVDVEGQHSEAQDYYARALKLSPANIQVLNNQALSKMATGDARAALKSLREAKNFAPAKSLSALSVTMNTALVQFMMGNPDRSLDTLKTVMGDEQAEEMLTEFAAMKGRIEAGESSLPQEAMQSAGKLISIRSKKSEEMEAYEVPAQIEMAPLIETTRPAARTLSDRAQTYPINKAPAEVEQLVRDSAKQAK